MGFMATRMGYPGQEVRGDGALQHSFRPRARHSNRLGGISNLTSNLKLIILPLKQWRAAGFWPFPVAGAVCEIKTGVGALAVHFPGCFAGAGAGGAGAGGA